VVNESKYQTVQSPNRTPALLLRLGLVSSLLWGSVSFAQDDQTDSNSANTNPTRTEPQVTLDDLRTFTDVFSAIRQFYVEDVDDRDLLEAALAGMLSDLDPHSEWISAEEYNNVEESATGRYGGLGIEFQIVDGRFTVITAVDGTPAEKAGIQPGQIILAVDGERLEDSGVQAAVEAMRGEPGTDVVLKIYDPAVKKDKPHDITLTREIIHALSVRSRILEDRYAYLRIASFQDETAVQVERSLNKLKEKIGSDPSGVILDVRNNPGGVLYSAVQSADHFLDSGKIVSTRGRTRESHMEFSADRQLLIPDEIPIVVLVNGGSASASEILAAALQDNERAIILGQQTFGKGSVQSVVPMRNGSAIRLTTSRYYTPNDRSIQLEGVTPDIILPNVTVSANRERTRESDLSGRLDNEGNISDKNPNAVPELAEEDYALFEAVNLLKSLNLASRGSARG
jgi:carboxyl-terminal processing protease